MLMRHDVTTAKEIDLSRCHAASERQRAVSRRTMALLAAAGMDRPARRWFLVRVGGGKDREAAAEMAKAHIETWLPVVWVMPARKGRAHHLKGVPRKPVETLAARGYLFAKVEPTVDAWAGLARMPGFMSLIGSDGHPLAIRDEAVDLFRAYLSGDPEAGKTVTNAVTAGDRAMLKDGPFKGFEGLISSVDDARGRAMMQMIMFGHVNIVSVELAQIRKL